MGLKYKLYKTYFKTIMFFTNILSFLQVIEDKLQLCCTVGLLGRPFHVYEGWGAQLGLCTTCYVVFATFDRMALPAYTGIFYLSFFIVCTAWLKLLTLWMLAVETHSFFQQ